MTDEEFNLLAAPRITQYRIKQIESRIRALEFSLLPSGIRYDQDKVQTSPEDQTSKVVTQIDRLERQADEMRQKIPQQVDAIREACVKLESEEERTVIMMYYIGGFHMDEIAEAINYSLKSAYRIRKSALEHLAPIVKGNFKVGWIES